MSLLGDACADASIPGLQARWLRGEPDVVDAMKKFAQFTDEARDALLAKNYAALADLMRENFKLRRTIYGDACLGADNIRMVEIAASLGAAAKFSGSGGAIVGMSDGEEHERRLEARFAAEGFGFIRLTPHEPSSER